MTALALVSLAALAFTLAAATANHADTTNATAAPGGR